VRRSITRTAAWALSIVLTLGAAVVPCAASDSAATPAGAPALTRLSPASQQLLARAVPAVAQQQPAATPSSPSSFFHSKRGAFTVALMGAGMGFALWSIHHDRQPVKSPIR
jgi:hypothetical protein